MATNKQEVELIVRAREVGTKTFKATTAAIKELNATLVEQVQQAQKGETSAAALVATMKKLETAGNQLIKQQALVDQYRRVAEQLDAARDKATQAAEAHRTLATAQEAAEKTTRAEVRQLTSLEKAAAGAQKRVETLERTLASQDEKLSAAGIATSDLANAQELLVASAREVGAALTVAGNAVDGYDEHLKKLKTTQDRVSADATFDRTLADARQLQQASSYVTFWTNALDEADRAQREMGEVAALRQKAADARQLQQAASYVDFWTQSLAEAERQERALAELTAFRKIGADAQATAGNLNGLNQQTKAGVTNNSRFAKSLQAMIDPAGAARATLSGLEAEIARVTTEIGDGTKPVREYQEAFNDLGRIQNAIMRQAGAIDAYRDQEIAVRKATAALTDRRNELRLAAAAVQGAAAPDQALVASLRQQEAAAEEAARALDNETKKLDRLGTALTAAGIDSRTLTKEQQRLAGVSKQTADAVNKLDGAMKGQNSRTGRFLGLRPYELQNLSYQLNDVFTQLASGTSITQTFAQQSGQIAQIPGVLRLVVTYLPGIVAVVAVLGSMYAAIKRITDLEASVRSFNKELAASADGANYSATQLAGVARAIEDTGVSAKDARAAVSAFVKEGIDPDRLEAFARAARSMSKVTGDDLPTAAGKMAVAFTRGYEAVAKLDDEFNFLTAAEREQIRLMFDSGRAAEARTRAFDIFTRHQDEAAAKAKGPWTDAIKSLTNAWRDFLDWLGKNEILQNTINEIKALAEGAEWLASKLPGAGSNPASSPLGVGQRAAGGGGMAIQREKRGDAGAWVTGNGQYADQNRAVARALFGSGVENPNGKIILTPELRDMAAMAYMEAIKDPQAQRDVAAVIMNRMERSGQTASQVVRAPGQFEPYSARRQEFDRTRADDNLVRSVLENLLPVLEGRVADPVGGATMFVSPGGQAANGRAMPRWADPSKMTQNRYGHQFYTGAFPGDRNGRNNNDDKAGQDYLRELEETRRSTQQVTDAERIRQAGLVALREAQNRGVAEDQQAAAQRYAEETERFKVDKERAEQRIALAGEIASSANSAASAQDRSLSQRIAAVTQQYDLLFQKIEQARKTGLTEVNGQTLEQVEAQARADMEAVKQRETMAFYEERLANIERERADILAGINSQLTTGAISAKEAVDRTAALNETFGGRLDEVTKDAVAFAKAIQEATPSPRLEAFIAKMQSAGLDAAANTTNAALKIYEDTLKRLTDARDNAIRGVLDQLDQNNINGAEALRQAQQIQDQLNPQIAEMAQSALTFAQGIGGATPSPALQAFLAEMQQTFDRASSGGSTNARATPVSQVGLASLASEEGKLNAIIAQRNEQVAVYNELAARRVITDAEARAQTQALYSETQPLIDAQVQAMQDLLTTLQQLGIITPQVYDLWSAKLKGVTVDADYLDERIIAIQNQLEQTFANGIVDGFLSSLDGLIKGTDAWNQRIEEGKSAFVAARDAFRTFAADFLAQIARMILQQMVLNALQDAANSGGGSGGGIFGSFARMVVGTKHTGGLGGDRSGIRRSVDPAMFFNAPKYHNGRNPLGLSAQEEAAIILKNEEVLTEDNPRHIKNIMGGGSSAASAPAPVVDVKVVNAIDSAEVVSEAMNTKQGGQAVLNWMGKNKRAARAALGVG